MTLKLVAILVLATTTIALWAYRGSNGPTQDDPAFYAGLGGVIQTSLGSAEVPALEAQPRRQLDGATIAAMTGKPIAELTTSMGEPDLVLGHIGGNGIAFWWSLAPVPAELDADWPVAHLQAEFADGRVCATALIGSQGRPPGTPCVFSGPPAATAATAAMP